MRSSDPETVAYNEYAETSPRQLWPKYRQMAPSPITVATCIYSVPCAPAQIAIIKTIMRLPQDQQAIEQVAEKLSTLLSIPVADLAVSDQDTSGRWRRIDAHLQCGPLCSPSCGSPSGSLGRLHTRRMRWQCWARVYPSPIFNSGCPIYEQVRGSALREGGSGMAGSVRQR